MIAPQSDEEIVALFFTRRSVQGFSSLRTDTESPWKPKTTYSVSERS